jgi:hypothetical protein
MEEEFVNDILDKLKSGEIREHFVTKEDFLDFRTVLVKREDFKHFQGIAQRGGAVLYQYLAEARS